MPIMYIIVCNTPMALYNEIESFCTYSLISWALFTGESSEKLILIDIYLSDAHRSAEQAQMLRDGSQGLGVSLV